MMKGLQFLVVSLCFGMLLSSCMQDSLSKCLDGNLVLSFSLEEEGKEVFSEIAGSVDILLFDSLYKLVHYERIEDREILREREVNLDIAAGSYYLISWMNRGENCTYKDLTESLFFEEGRLFLKENSIGDALYYGPKERAGGTIPHQIEVQENRDTKETIRYVKAHRRLRFYIEGVVDEYNGEVLPPLVEISEVPEGYDFMMNLIGKGEVSLLNRTELITVRSRNMAYREMYLPVFPLSRRMEVTIIKNSDNSPLTRFNLADYLFENPPEDAYEIEIYIGFFSGSVEITLPGWNSSEEITPGW